MPPQVKVTKIPLDPLVLNGDLQKYVMSKINMAKKMTRETTRNKLRKFYVNNGMSVNKEVRENALVQLWNRYDENVPEFRVAYPSHECQAFMEYIMSDYSVFNLFYNLKSDLSERRADSLVTENKITIRLKLDKLRVIRSVYLALNKHTIQYSVHDLHSKHFRFLKVVFMKANEFIKECKEIEVNTRYDKRQQKYIQSVKKTLEAFVSIYKDRREKIMDILKDDAGLKKKMPYDMLRYISGFVGN